MRRRRLFFISILFVALIIIGYFSLRPVFNHLKAYLSKSEQVDANILIVEGWLPWSAIETAYDEFRNNSYKYIITTGIKTNDEYYEESLNGYLIFYPGKRFSSFTVSGQHTIEISAYSEHGGENCAHFNVYMNDSIVSGFLANKRKQKYSVSWKGTLSKIDSIMVKFDNDIVSDFEGRCLYVKEVIIDHNITIPFRSNSAYDILIPGGKRRVINNYNSFAQLAKNELLALGMDSSKIIAIPAKEVKINRTLTSAFAVREWLRNSDIKVEGINIISEGTHARRTWMTYNKVLTGSYKVGIFSLPDNENFRTHKMRLLYNIRQMIAIVYYWFILLPY